jgi:hypothetical protein
MVDEKELRVIHYTLGPLKPWDWFTAWLVKPVEIWQVTPIFINFSLTSICNFRSKNDKNVIIMFYHCRILGKHLKNLSQELVGEGTLMTSWS